jgi:hypothetical protein
MSNGYGGIGEIRSETGTVHVGEWWTSGESGVEISCTPAMSDLIGDNVRLTQAEALHLLDLLNKALGLDAVEEHTS